jgi:O-antigen/teichoic acid export membrane protein
VEGGTAAGWLLGGDTAARVAGQVAIVISARLKGPEKYGELAVGLAALSICVLLCDFGLGDAAGARFPFSSRYQVPCR